jgi:hypothetical protein
LSCRAHCLGVADFRNDIYVPLCYDAEGAKTYLKVIIGVAALRIEGMSPAGLKAEIKKRYKNECASARSGFVVHDRAGYAYVDDA